MGGDPLAWSVCYRCGQGIYRGNQSESLTNPCDNCGHIMPAKLSRPVLRVLKEARDKEQQDIAARTVDCSHCDGKGAPDKGGNIPCAGPGCVLGKVLLPLSALYGKWPKSCDDEGCCV